MKLSVPLFQADQEFVGPFGGNFFQTQPSVKSTNVMRHNSKAQDLQENSKRPPKKQRQRMLCKPPSYANYGNSNLGHRINIQREGRRELEGGFAKV